MDTIISDKTKMKFLDGIIPLLEEARDISAQWNGDEPGDQENRAHICNKIFDMGIGIKEAIEELENL